jgi:hypothetical protein
MSVKWRYYKMIKRYASGPPLEAVNHGYITPWFDPTAADSVLKAGTLWTIYPRT